MCNKLLIIFYWILFIQKKTKTKAHTHTKSKSCISSSAHQTHNVVFRYTNCISMGQEGESSTNGLSSYHCHNVNRQMQQLFSYVPWLITAFRNHAKSSYWESASILCSLCTPHPVISHNSCFWSKLFWQQTHVVHLIWGSFSVSEDNVVRDTLWGPCLCSCPRECSRSRMSLCVFSGSGPGALGVHVSVNALDMMSRALQKPSQTQTKNTRHRNWDPVATSKASASQPSLSFASKQTRPPGQHHVMSTFKLPSFGATWEQRRTTYSYSSKNDLREN